MVQDRIDWALLQAQKQRLVEMRADIGEPHNNQKEKDALALDGIIAFIDSYQDQAAERLGEEVVFCDFDPDRLTGE